ncbi:PepSY domain-containing protein [Lysinibacillus sp. NPDC097287]|uniref:PepSY domain-containing protein n=1 Tax=Lysinibacillus sp. NPDC097287 TaxID=3364144 RepID=UPI0038107360
MKKWLITITVIIIVCAVALWFFRDYFVKEDPLSKKEAITHIQSLYNGQVKHIEKQGNQYEIELLRNGATYEVAIDVNTRQITDLLLKEAVKKSLLSEVQIRKYVTDYAPGEIESIALENTYYKVQVTNDNKIKNLLMDAYTGEVISEKDTPKEVNEPVIEKVVLSEQKAIQIAQQELQGEVESVKYKETADGGYYLIEIESDNAEATFEIHGVTGKIMSVSLEEND